MTRARDIENLEGRVLAHVYDDTSGAPQMILEGTDAHVHFIRHTPAMEQMRQEGGLKPNSFVSMDRVGSSGADLLLRIEDRGDSDIYLSSTAMKTSANRLIQLGIITATAEYGGWLGKYHFALAQHEWPTQGPSATNLARPNVNRGR